MATVTTSVPQGCEPSERLLERLRFLSRRLRAVARARTALWCLVLAAAGGLLVGWVDMLAALPALLRVLGAAAVFALAAAFAVRGSVLARREARATAVARDVDRLSGSGGQVAVGLDLTELSPRLPALTVALARVAVRRAGDIAFGVPHGRVAPLRGAVKALRCFLAAVAAVTVLACVWPRAFTTEWARLTDPWGDLPPYSRYAFRVSPGDTYLDYGDSVTVTAEVTGAPAEQLDLVVRQPDGTEEAMPMFQERDGSWRGQLTDVTAPLAYWVRVARARSLRYAVSVIYTPRIEGLRVRITPPPYTNTPPVEGPPPPAGIAGLPGTGVQITVESNRPLSRGDLRLTPEGEEPRMLAAVPEPEAPKAVAWDFAIEKAGELSLWVTDEAGTRSAAETSMPILLLDDKRPFVRIVSPMARSFATPDVVLPVEVQAEDDYGIGSLLLYRSLNGSRHLAAPLAVPVPAGPRLQAGSSLPLPDYGLSPGDVISLFCRVEDTDPAGPKGSESEIVQLTIISREVYEEMLRAEKTVADFEAKYAAAARQAEGLMAEADRLAEAAEGERGEQVSEEARTTLESLAERLQEAARETARAADQEPLYALDADLAGPLRELAASLEEASKAAEAAARAGTPDEMRALLAKARAALGGGRESYRQDVQDSLERFMQAYALLEMAERFVSLYERQRELAGRMSNLKGRAGGDDPALRVRMRDLQEEQEAVNGDLRAVVDEIRARAAELPEDAALEKLRATAIAFADAVEAGRALPAMSEACQALANGRGSDACERAVEAADAMEKLIAQCQAAGGAGLDACELCFQPSMQQSARMTAGQLLQAAGLGMATGEGGWTGSGRGGYSMRTDTLANVGIYGPATRDMPTRGGGRDANAPSTAWSVTGGTVGGDIGTSAQTDLTYEGMPMQGVPPQHRDRVRAYFRQVADEMSAGTTLEQSPSDRGP